MPIVRSFDRSMIESCLRTNQMKFLRDNDGDFRVEFGFDDEMGCELTISLAAAGQQHDIFSMLIFTDKRIPNWDWNRVIQVCNEWNDTRRWPKAYLHVRDTSDSTAGILLEQSIDLEHGIHQELFDDLTM